jgi:hypothetical protein
MTVAAQNGVIRLHGRCLVEDAEPLLLALQDDPEATVDLAEASRLHLAVVQILLALRPSVTGTPQDPVVARHLLASLTQISSDDRDLGLGT